VRLESPALCLSLAALAGCAAGSDPIGASEPFRIRGAQFIPGSLPGKAPQSETSSSTPATVNTRRPVVTALMSPNNVIYQGEGGKKLSGEATPASRSIGIALHGIGSGYWVLPTGGVNPQTDNLIWSVAADFDRGIAAGKREVRVVAFDDHDVAGQQVALTICVDTKVPDNLHACDPKRPLPQAVISLSWDANVDLDLQVHTPDDELLDSKHRATAMPDDMGNLPDDVGIIDRDSNAGCVIDGIRTENLVWSKVMPQGRYAIYANLYDACHLPAVRFRAEVYGLVTDDNGDDKLERFYANGGELLDLSANGGSARGLFVTEFVFQ